MLFSCMLSEPEASLTHNINDKEKLRLVLYRAPMMDLILRTGHASQFFNRTCKFVILINKTIEEESEL